MRDSVSEIYLPPFQMRTIGEATRGVLTTAKNTDSHLYSSPDDYTLWQIATFDDNSGDYIMLKDKLKIGSVSELLSIHNQNITDGGNIK